MGNKEECICPVCLAPLISDNESLVCLNCGIRLDSLEMHPEEPLVFFTTSRGMGYQNIETRRSWFMHDGLLDRLRSIFLDNAVYYKKYKFNPRRPLFDALFLEQKHG